MTTVVTLVVDADADAILHVVLLINAVKKFNATTDLDVAKDLVVVGEEHNPLLRFNSLQRCKPLLFLLSYFIYYFNNLIGLLLHTIK